MTITILTMSGVAHAHIKLKPGQKRRRYSGEDTAMCRRVLKKRRKKGGIQLLCTTIMSEGKIHRSSEF